MIEVRYTATLAVETPRGRRWQGVSYAGRGPRSYADRVGERLPRGAVVRYRTRLHVKRNEAYEQARGRTIHHNLYHGEEWPQGPALRRSLHGDSGARCIEVAP